MLLFARQHGESQTRILYSRALIMLVTVALAVVPLVGATALAKHDVCLAWLDESMFVLLDVILACAMLYSIGGPYLYYSLFTSAARPELTALRAVSSLVVTACVLTIVVTLLPRPVLFAGAVLTHAVFLNTTSWVTSVALRLQTDGLAPLLPKTVDAVLSTPPLELLNRTTGSPAAVQRLVRTARQVAALCLLSEEDQQEALELLPLALRAKLQRSLASELPSPLQQLLSPWAEGSNYLRVDELTIAQTAALADPRKQTLFFSLPEHVEQATMQALQLVAEGVKGVTLGISYLPLAFGEWVRDNTVQVGRDLLAKAVPGPVKAVLASRETPMTPLQRSYEDLREFSQAVSFKAPSPAASSTDSSSPVHE